MKKIKKQQRKIKKQQREKRKENKKELKRFDTILKEIFSEAIGTIYYLAIGKKIGKKSQSYICGNKFGKDFSS
jgi:hypothetical protein